MSQTQKSDVNVHERAIRAAERTNGANGRLSEVLDREQSIARSPWYKRILERLFRREDLVVAGREVKGAWVVPQPIALLLLGSILGGGGYMYQGISRELALQHDQLTRLATQKEDEEKARKQEHDDHANQESADRAWRENMSNQMHDLQYVVQNRLKAKGGPQ